MNAVAFFSNESSPVRGTLRFFQSSPLSTVRVTLRLDGFRPFQTHAIHIHEYGDLTQGCQSTGKHFNPCHCTHGSKYTSERHAGDLINNIFTDKDGNVRLEWEDANLSLVGGDSHCIVGRSVVLHRDADDYGLGGILQHGQWTPCSELSYTTLQQMATVRGYKGLRSKRSLVEKFQTESLSTGNAGGRIACAVIGWSAPSDNTVS